MKRERALILDHNSQFLVFIQQGHGVDCFGRTFGTFASASTGLRLDRVNILKK